MTPLTIVKTKEGRNRLTLAEVDGHSTSLRARNLAFPLRCCAKEVLMKRLLSKTSLVGIVVVIAVASFSFLAQAEKKKSTGTNKFGPIISQTTAPLADVPNHEII